MYVYVCMYIQVSEFSAQVPGTDAQDVMELLLITQYFDMLREVGGKVGGKESTIFLPHTPDSVNQLRMQLKSKFGGGQLT